MTEQVTFSFYADPTMGEQRVSVTVPAQTAKAINWAKSKAETPEEKEQVHQILKTLALFQEDKVYRRELDRSINPKILAFCLGEMEEPETQYSIRNNEWTASLFYSLTGRGTTAEEAKKNLNQYIENFKTATIVSDKLYELQFQIDPPGVTAKFTFNPDPEINDKKAGEIAQRLLNCIAKEFSANRI